LKSLSDGSENTHDIREILGDLIDDLIPEHHSVPHGVGLGHIGEQLSGTSLRELERIGGDSLDTDAREDGDLFGRTVLMSAVMESRDPVFGGNLPVPISWGRPR
jgi:hypothetical protein